MSAFCRFVLTLVILAVAALQLANFSACRKLGHGVLQCYWGAGW